MEHLLERISEYDIIYSIVPGTLVAGVLDCLLFDGWLFEQNILTLTLMMHLLGGAASRVDSLVVEPVLLRIKFIQYSECGKYLEAKEKDRFLHGLVSIKVRRRSESALASRNNPCI